MANAFAPFDYNQAVGAGTKNALNQLQFQNAAQQMRDRAIQQAQMQKLYQLAGQAYQGDQNAANQLSQIPGGIDILNKIQAINKPQPGFTLDKTRYDAAGNIIAQAPEKPAQPLSSIGKLKADFKAGRINKEEYNAGLMALGAPPMGAEVAAGNNLNGEDFLKTLDPTTSRQVQAYAEGRMPLPTGFALKSPYFQNMLRMITQYDPSFDAVNYQARYNTRKNFTSGKNSDVINRMNTVIGHLGTLSKDVEDLNNTSIPWANAVKNWALTNSGDPRVRKFNTARTAVANELTLVYRMMGGSIEDIKGWQEQMNASDSPQQLQSVISQMGNLLESKLHAMKSQYEQGMGTTKYPMKFVSDEARNALTNLEKSSGSTMDMDKQAIEWARQNPNDPRARKILEINNAVQP